MIILGIDPGANNNRTGRGVTTKNVEEVIGKSIKYIAHGCIVTENINTMPRLYLLLHGMLNDIIHKHSPHFLIVENILFGRNIRTVISVSQVEGVIMLSAGFIQSSGF